MPRTSSLLKMILLICTVILGFAGQPASARTLVLEQWFSGRTIGKGVVSLPIVGVDRQFCVITQGIRSGSSLKLIEDFVYADGERERKTWRFTRSGPGRYSGTREDVIGQARVWQDGDVVRLSYDIELPSKGGLPIRLHFIDVIGLDPDGLAVNEAVISLIGLPIGSARVVFSKSKHFHAKAGCSPR